MSKTKIDMNRLHELFVDGKANDEISKLLGKVPSTIQWHRQRWEKAGSPVPVTRERQQPLTSDEIVAEGEKVPGPESLSAAAEPAVSWSEPPKVRRTLQEGETYEGAVAVIGDTYVLVELVELADDSGLMEGCRCPVALI